MWLLKWSVKTELSVSLKLVMKDLSQKDVSKLVMGFKLGGIAYEVIWILDQFATQYAEMDLSLIRSHVMTRIKMMEMGAVQIVWLKTVGAVMRQVRQFARKFAQTSQDLKDYDV